MNSYCNQVNLGLWGVLSFTLNTPRNNRFAVDSDVNLSKLFANWLNMQKEELNKRVKMKLKQEERNTKLQENKAIAFHQSGRLEEAEKIYRDLVNSGSKNHIIYGNLAIICGIRKNLNEKVNLLKYSLMLSPDNHVAHNNLGNALFDKGNIKAAISSYQQAIKYKSDYSEAYYNLAIALQEQDDINAAISYYKQAIRYKPEFPEAHFNLGNTLKNKGDITSAISSFQEAIKYNPNYYLAHENLGYTFLLNSEYKKGWLKHEYRFIKETKPVIPHALPKIEKWQGENLNSKEKLLIVSEQGLGDTFQFMRYLPYLKRKGINFSFCTLKKLHGIIKSSGITSNPLTPEQGNDVKEGKWIPLLSLPRFLDVTPANPIVSKPYINCSAKLNDKWKEILSKEKSSIIGINWQGNPNIEKTNLKGRSFPLEIFSLIAKNNDYKFLSLQKGFGSEQLDKCSFRDHFVKCQDKVNDTWDFLETASIIANCDLVITSDSSVAHLAGGMGLNTWSLIHYVPDWRWGIKGEKSFWYPSMTLFRQEERNNWEKVIEKVNIRLKLFQSKKIIHE